MPFHDSRRLLNQRAQQAREATLERGRHPVGLYFYAPAAPAGQRRLGLAIVRATNLVEAIALTIKLGINPGGAVAEFEVPPHAASLRNRLLTSAADLALLGLNNGTNARG